MHFTYLQKYSEFLLNHHMDALANQALEKARQSNLHMILANYTTEELVKLIQSALKELILVPLTKAPPYEQFIQKPESWKTNISDLPQKDLWDIEDVIIAYTIVQELLIDFLHSYDSSKEELIILAKEINLFFTTCINKELKSFGKARKEELSEQKELLAGILSNIPIVVTKLNKEGKIVSSTGAGLKSIDSGNNELFGDNITDNSLNAEYTQKVLNGEPANFTGTVYSTDGKQKQFETIIIPQKDGALGFSIDVTQQRETEELLDHMVEGIKDYAIFMLNPDGTVATWNEGAKELKGYTKEEILGKHFSIFYTKEKREAHFPEFELSVAEKNGRFEDEGYRVKKDGSIFWANVVITPIYNQANKLLGFTKITRDLTNKKQTEEELRRSEIRNRLLINNIKDYAIFLLDPEGKVSSWNEGARRLKGYTENEIIGKHFSIFYTQDKIDAKFPEYELEQAQKLGRFEDEGLRIKKDGTTFYANVVITPLYDNNKQLIGFSKITRDLTERKMLEENLRQTNLALEAQVKERTMELEQRTKELGKTVVELKRINNDLDNFIYTASHDLKSPISNLEGLFYGLYEELEEQTKNNENIKTFKELIDVSIKRFQTTILELTEIAKVQKELVDYAEEVDLKELIEDVKISITDQINKTDAQIIVTLNNCDKIRFIRKNLKSIFYNLISNGIKYKSPDRTPIIKISCTNRENNYILTFEDNGLGLKEENMSKLFTMFKRFHDHVEGSGIGLYIIKRIIENAGGKIEVKSEEHVGTCFRIFIPKSIE